MNVNARGQGMVAGDLVNTASRLQSVAAPGVVLVDDATRRAAEAAVVFEDVGEQVLKGKSASLAASRAVRVVAERGGRRRSGTLEAPFVGRDDELRMLQDIYHATVRERRARLVSITGQAGIGKSRLVWELEKYFDGLVETLFWHHGRSPTYGEGITFWALGEMVRRRAGLAESDDEATTRARISVTVNQWIPDETDRRWIETSLLALLGVGEVPGEGRDELFAAWRAFFEAIARQAPTVLVFEDLHASDSGLLDFIDHLLDWSRDYPILVITMARPELLERRPSWGAGRRNFVGMALEPLPDASMRELLAGLVPGLPDTVVRAILSRADGVPLYAVETVRMLVNEGRLERVGEAYQPIGDLGGMAVPESLHALIAARLDAIVPADRQLLQDGAVLGQSFSVAALAALAGEPAGTLEPRLRALVRRELLRFEDDPRSPERGQYGFTQGLVREVAYGTLRAGSDATGISLRRGTTRRSATRSWPASLPPTTYPPTRKVRRATSGPRCVSRPASPSTEPPSGRPAWAPASRRCVTSRMRSTIALDPAEEAVIRESAGVAATAAGRVDDAARHLDRAIELYEQRGEGESVLRATTIEANCFISVLRLAEAAALLDAVLARHPELLGSTEAVAVSAALARCAYMNGDYHRAVTLAELALDAAEHSNQIDLIADTLTTRANSLISFGRGRESRIIHEGVIRFAEVNGLTRAGMRALISLCATQATTEPRDGMALARRSLPQARRLGWRTVERYLVCNGAEAALRLGEWDWTITEIERLLPELSDTADRCDAVAELTSVHALRGQPVAELVAELLAMAPDHPQGRSESDACCRERPSQRAGSRTPTKRPPMASTCQPNTASLPYPLPRTPPSGSETVSGRWRWSKRLMAGTHRPSMPTLRPSAPDSKRWPGTSAPLWPGTTPRRRAGVSWAATSTWRCAPSTWPRCSDRVTWKWSRLPMKRAPSSNVSGLGRSPTASRPQCLRRPDRRRPRRLSQPRATIWARARRPDRSEGGIIGAPGTEPRVVGRRRWRAGRGVRSTCARYRGSTRHMHRLVSVLSLSAAAVMVIGSGSILAASPAPISDSSAISADPALHLIGTRWTLTSMDGDAVPADVTVTLAFGEDGRGSGSGGCNQYSGDYTATGSSISFGPMNTTRMTCDGAAGTTENAYLADLALVTTWAVPADGAMGTELTLSGAGATPKLVFGPTPQTAADLVGTSWYLFSIDGTETGTQVQTLIFNSDTAVSGSGGCNSFSGPYTATDTEIAFGNLAMTMMFCDGPVGVNETAYFADLAKVTTWQIPAGAAFGSSLSLSGKDGVPMLVFQAAGPAQATIAGTSWTLSSIDGTAVPTGVQVSLAFGTDQQVSGSGGCNAYHAGFTIDGAAITFEVPASTKMHCPDPQGSTETAYFSALAKVTEWSVGSDGSLTLSGTDGAPALVFASAG